MQYIVNTLLKSTNLVHISRFYIDCLDYRIFFSFLIFSCNAKMVGEHAGIISGSL